MTIREPAPRAHAVRLAAAAAALACLSLGMWIALHHPLAPSIVLVATLLAGIAFLLRPAAWLFVVPALLPLVDLAPWTGWIVVEEFDLLVLAAAAGGYAAVTVQGVPRGGDDARLSAVAIAAIALYAISIAVGLARGFVVAVEPSIGWFDGYTSAQNSLRVAKGFAFAVLMLPLLQLELRRSSARAIGLLASGLAAGLGAASLVVLWERVAFPGLLNFSSDYRATGAFWEMHVGGAALDGFLVLTAPFAIWEFLHESRRLRWELAGGLILLAAYASLTTFSRGVYLALPLSLAVLAVLLLVRRERLAPATAVALVVRGCLLLGLAALAAFVVFRAGGYRSLLAVLGVLALALPLLPAARTLSLRDGVAAVIAGAVAGFAVALVASRFGKGPYVAYAMLFVVAAATTLTERRRTADRLRSGAAVAAWLALAVAAATVAGHWGGHAALRDTAVVLALLALGLASSARAKTPPWPDALPAHAIVVGLAALVGIATAVFTGGAYMAGRFTSSERDLDERLGHWRHVASLLHGPADAVLGRGLGRLPQSYAAGGPPGELPGSYRMARNDGKHSLVLFGPTREAGFGEVLRVGQRLWSPDAGPYTIVLDARAPVPARLHVELCERWLLYEAACGIAKADVGTDGVGRKRIVVTLGAGALGRAPWYARRTASFALAVESPDRAIEIDYVSLLDEGGVERLANGDFHDDLARWFPTSVRLHLPWHAKNIALNVLFDQGLAGLALFTLLVAYALWRVVFGSARRHPVAPFLAAALSGFLVVGVFDSLIDAPRLAFLFFLLVFAGLLLPDDAVAVPESTRAV